MKLLSTSDRDECTQDPGLCDNGQCLNFAGGYRCECDMGFMEDPTSRTCVGKREEYCF